jgi:hypothetical protein
MFKKLLFSILCAFISVLSVSAQSEDCDNSAAGLLTVGSSCSPTTWNSTNDTKYWAGPYTCGADNRDDAWGHFVANSTSTTITYNPDEDDAILTLFQGNCSTGMTSIDCANNGGDGVAETIVYSTTVGQTYRVRIQRAGSKKDMLGTICVYDSVPAAPSNDDCSTATSLTVYGSTCTASTSGTTTGGTPSTEAAINCGGNTGDASDDVWYSFTATGTAHDITVTPGTIGDFVVDLRSGACSGTTIDCADAVSSGNEVINATGLTIGATYYVRVYSYSASGNEGTFNICVTTPGVISYCTPSVSSGYESSSYINQINFVGTLNDTYNSSTYSSSPRGYQDFTGLANKSRQAQGEGINIYNEYVTTGTNTLYVKAWVDWNKDGDFTDTGELVYDINYGILSSTFGFIVPTTQSPGFYTLRIRANQAGNSANQNFGPCDNITNYGETEDYQFEVIANCPNVITDLTDGVACGPNQNVVLNFEGSAGSTGFNVYADKTGGSPLTPAPTFTTPGGVPTGEWATPPISTTTSYWITAINGCESLARTEIIAKIKPVATLTFSPTTPEVCGEDHTVKLSAAGDNELVHLINEDFEGTANNGMGVFTRIHDGVTTNGTTFETRTQWTQRTSTYVPDELVWFPAIASDFGTNKFVMSNSDVAATDEFYNDLQSVSVNSTGFLDLTLKYDMYYSDYSETGAYPTGDYVEIRVSTDGGTTWTTERIDYDADVGVGTDFETVTVDLSAYINETDLKVSFYYYSKKWTDGIALDNVELYGYKPLTSSFTWTSTTTIDAYLDEAATTPYVSGTTAASVYIKPTTEQLQTLSFSFIANTTLTNGCTIGQNVTINNKTKYWEGIGSTDWDDPNNWLPAGVPTSLNCVIIPDNTIISGNGYDAYARNVIIRPTGNLELQSGNNLIITEWLDVNTNGNFDIRDSASLVQIDDVDNTGIVKTQRDSKPMYKYDYTYWTTPNTAASGFTLKDLSPETLGDKYFSWLPTQSGGHGNWIMENSNTKIMDPATGYAIRAPQSFSTNPAVKTIFTATFSGTPNNGEVLTPIAVGTDNTLGQYLGDTMIDEGADQWNLIGNPYPSAIDILDFLNETNNSTLLDGTAYVWTHNSPPNTATPDPFYANYGYNYTSNDYASINSLGGTSTSSYGQAPSQYFASGQAFFVLGMNNGNAVFNNAMRVKNDNDQFFKSGPIASTNTTFTDFEKHRIWLNLSNDNGAFSQILIGYAEGATLGWDCGIDAVYFGGNNVKFYSLTSENKLSIQGKPLPFETSDVVPLGFNAVNQGSFRIGLDHIDSLFENKEIFLRDKTQNIVHDLKSSPYIFNTDAGTFEDRFEITYTNDTLSTEAYVIDSNEIKVISNTNLTVVSQSKTIKNIEVYDILGKKLMTFNNVDSKNIQLTGLRKSNNALLLKIVFNDNTLLYKKVLY